MLVCSSSLLQTHVTHAVSGVVCTHLSVEKAASTRQFSAHSEIPTQNILVKHSGKEKWRWEYSVRCGLQFAEFDGIYSRRWRDNQSRSWLKTAAQEKTLANAREARELDSCTWRRVRGKHSLYICGLGAFIQIYSLLARLKHFKESVILPALGWVVANIRHLREQNSSFYFSPSI